MRRLFRQLPYVDRQRVAVAGHSLGGQLALLEAERDATIRATVTFGAAAGSWDESEETRNRLLAAASRLTAPVALIHAENDYSLSPGRALALELSRRSKPHILKIYPAYGPTPRHGHNFFYLDVARWERDVFAFLDANVKSRH
jgi:dienelactone hydrolase